MTSSNISAVNIEPWFLPMDVIMILCSSFAIPVALIFLLIIIFDRTCHTVPMMLIGNSCLAEFFFSSVILSSAIFTFHNDLEQIHQSDFFCILRGYIGYVVTVLQNYSYLLQAIYRYVTVVYPNRLAWRSTKVQLSLISFTWIFGFVATMPCILTNEIQYQSDDQVCQLPVRLSLLAVYNVLCVFMISMSLIMLIYFKLIRYVRSMKRHITPVSTLSRANRELQMVRRIVILINGLAILGFPYALLVLWSFFAPTPKYDIRIAYIFVDVSLPFVMIILFKFTDSLRTTIMKMFGRRINRTLPAMT